jgi:hypothetical protein
MATCFNSINSDTKEGKLLLTAIGLIMTFPGYTDKTPEQIIKMLNNALYKKEEKE